MKNNTPLIIGAVIVVIIGAFWFLQSPVAVPSEVAEVPEFASTTPSDASSQPVPAGANPLPAGLPPNVQVEQTLWKDFTDPSWKLMFKYQPQWNFTETRAEDKTVSQVTVAGPTGNYFVSRNLAVAHPSGLTPKVSTAKIAGVTIQVEEYVKPNDKYAYYLYFDIPLGGDTYYVLVKSATTSKKTTNDFIGFIEAKK